MARFLVGFLQPDLDLKVQVRLSYAWGEDPQSIQPTHHWPVLSPCLSLMGRKGVDVDIHIRTHPFHLDEWVELLVSSSFIRGLTYALAWTRDHV